MTERRSAPHDATVRVARSAGRAVSTAPLALLVSLMLVTTGSGAPVPAVGAAAGAAYSVRVGDPHARGHWSVRPGTSGDVLLWRSPARLPVTDSRPEFRVGTRVVGYPRIARNDRSLSLPVGAMGGADPADVQVWVGLHQLDTTAPALPRSQVATAPISGTGPRPRPRDAGPFSVQSFDYSAADLPWPGWDAPMEVLGHAVLPLGVRHAPLAPVPGVAQRIRRASGRTNERAHRGAHPPAPAARPPQGPQGPLLDSPPHAAAAGDRAGAPPG